MADETPERGYLGSRDRPPETGVEAKQTSSTDPNNVYGADSAFAPTKLSGAAALDIEREAVRVRRFALERLTHPDDGPFEANGSEVANSKPPASARPRVWDRFRAF